MLIAILFFISLSHTQNCGPRTAIVFRTHNATSDQISRIQKHAQNAQDIDFIVLSDFPRDDIPNVEMFRYTVDDAKRMYSSIREPFEWKPLFKFCHTTAVNIWFQPNPKYEHVWVFEADASFSGNISDLVLFYQNSTADLLSWGIKQLNMGPRRDLGTKAFKKYYPPKSRWYMREHVVRYSKTLLNEIHKRALQGHGYGFSEVVTPTICQEAKLQCELFDKKHVGSKYDYDKCITLDEFENILKNEKDKLWHKISSNCNYFLGLSP